MQYYMWITRKIITTVTGNTIINNRSQKIYLYDATYIKFSTDIIKVTEVQIVVTYGRLWLGGILEIFSMWI